MYLPKEEPTEARDTPVRNEAPWTMLAPMLTLAAGIVLLGLFNGEIVSHFIEPALPAGLASSGNLTNLFSLAR